MGTAGQNRTDLHLLIGLSVLVHTFIDNARRPLGCNHMIGLDNHIAVLILDGLAGEPSCNTLLQ